MSRLSGFLWIALLLGTLLAPNASAGSGNSGDPEIPNTTVRVKPRGDMSATNDSAVLEIRSAKNSSVSRWSPVIRLILTWTRVTAR
jgi:hypothetical protein